MTTTKSWLLLRWPSSDPFPIATRRPSIAAFGLKLFERRSGLHGLTLIGGWAEVNPPMPERNGGVSWENHL